MLACHGEIESVLSIPLNNAYTTPSRLTSTLMSLGAGEFTVFAPIALGGIYGKRLWGHGSVLSKVVGVCLLLFSIQNDCWYIIIACKNGLSSTFRSFF